MKELPKFVLISIVIGLVIMPVSNIVSLSTKAYALNSHANFLGLPGIASIIVVPTDYPKIQSAIHAAKAGDTIKVLPGTYTEQLSIRKNINLIGSGATSTIINAPPGVKPGVLQDRPVVVEIKNEAKVIMKDLTVRGISGTDCIRFLGISVIEEGSLNLDSFIIKGCNSLGVLVGAPARFPGGPQVGHATITNTEISEYRGAAISAFQGGSDIKATNNKVIAADSGPVAIGMTGIEAVSGAKGIIQKNRISGNICNDPVACGPDFFTQTQATGINAFAAAKRTIISNNDVSNNDIGISVGENSKCCKVFNNIVKDNRFFGITLVDGEYTSSLDKISGGGTGVAAVSFGVNTVATLVNDKVKDTDTPFQELTCGGSAKIVVIPPKSIHPEQIEC